MDLYKDKYVIVEIIPTTFSSKTGFIAQISALKMEGLKLIDRFDYRVKDELIDNIDVKNIINYDKNMFSYVNNIYFIPEKFKVFVGDLPLILIENEYTDDYLSYLKNNKELVYKYLDMEYNQDVINNIMKKYNIEPTNHIVDIIYEALIFNNNKKGE